MHGARGSILRWTYDVSSPTLTASAAATAATTATAATAANRARSHRRSSPTAPLALQLSTAVVGFLQNMALIRMLGCFLLLSLVVTVMSSPTECIKNQQACINNKECCDGCCNERKCVTYADGCSAHQNPCSLHYCPPGKTCYLQQVTCVSANCEPVPACKDSDYDY